MGALERRTAIAREGALLLPADCDADALSAAHAASGGGMVGGGAA
jgi:hypothetical protein